MPPRAQASPLAKSAATGAGECGCAAPAACTRWAPHQPAAPAHAARRRWHYDHGSLTGLCSAVYLDARGAQVACPDKRAGLYIRDRGGRTAQVSIPPDHIAFQVGEAMQASGRAVAKGGRPGRAPRRPKASACLIITCTPA